jgi:hypothetical protein
MPGWIWIVLVAFMLVVLALGGFYAFKCVMKLSKVVKEAGEEVAARMGDMKVEPEAGESHDSLLAQPLWAAADHYSQAHVRIDEKHMRRHRNHVATWNRWMH